MNGKWELFEMNKKFYIKNITMALFYLVVTMVINFSLYKMNDVIFNRITFYLFISVPLYPFSKKIIQNIAYLFLKEKTWRKIIGDDISTPKLDALFSFICMMVAIPVGGGYSIYLLMRRLGK